MLTLLVRDYDEALTFYVGKLGFELIEDTPVADPAKRWVVIRPQGGGCRILLALAAGPEQLARVGEEIRPAGAFFYSCKPMISGVTIATFKPGVSISSNRPAKKAMRRWPFSKISTATGGTCCSLK